MKSSKTSDPNPISLYRALTLPLQTHIPARMIQQTGARRSEVACTSLKSDSPWDEAEKKPKIDKPDDPAASVWVWVVVVVPVPVTVVVVVVIVSVTVGLPATVLVDSPPGEVTVVVV